MERASKLIRGLRLSGEIITPEQIALAVWPEAVGPKIAEHTRAAKLVRTHLIIEVEDVTWQRQLYALAPFIVKNLARGLGDGMVEHVEFRVVPRRRDADRARNAVPPTGGLFDDSEGIADPVMRDLYRLSRKKALA
jgi:hypothetical protein